MTIGKKLFSYMYSDTRAVEALKISNKVTIEANRNRFSLYHYYLRKRGEREGALIRGGRLFFILAERVGAYSEEGAY